MDDRRFTRGRLLVATPLLADGNFDRTVVFVLEHSEEGALGLVLNRPLDVDLHSTVPEWSVVGAPPATVFQGGPVQPEAAFCLARLRDPLPTEGWTAVLGDLGVADLGRSPADVAGDVLAARVFAGYAGWSPSQLERELEEQAWWVVDTRPDDVFSDQPDGLWRAVLRRQRPPLSWMAGFPDDVNDN